MRVFLSIILASFLFLPAPVSPAQGNEGEENFFHANRLYKDGLFKSAAEGYEALLEEGQISGHVYFNLGNAYFRLGELGRAILNYERARLLIPRDADLNFNLNYARDQGIDSIEEEQDFLRAAFFWIRSYNLKELFYGFAIINILFFAILIIRLFNKSEWSYYASIIFLIFWLISGVSFGLKYYWISTDERSVIIEKEADILAGPDEKDTVLFRLHEGTIVYIDRAEDTWRLVSLPDGKRGWINGDALERIMKWEIK
ncbi:MAG: hypothetical protein JW882_10935 [Deltaproteobacteria bacterium]|nr:hypothetical protein [Deltaproteobacteria bacterium]